MEKIVDENDPKSVSSAVSAADILSNSSPKSDLDLQRHDQLFLRFEAFNFDNDSNFQAGLAKLFTDQNSTEKKRENAVDLLRIKSFYYSKNVEPMDFTAYLEWKQTHGRCLDRGTSLADDDSGAGDEGRHDSLAVQNKAFSGDCQPPCEPHLKVCENVSDTHHLTYCEESQTGDLQPLCDIQGKMSLPSGGHSSSVVRQEHASHTSHTEVGVTRVVDSGVTATSLTETLGKVLNQDDDIIRVQQTGTDLTCAGMDANQTGIDMNQDGNSIEQTDRGKVQSCEDDNKSASDEYHANNRSVECPAEITGGQELSFAEIAELIQSGKPIPGLIQSEVVPTNMAPTPSQLHRTKKPWEE